MDTLATAKSKARKLSNSLTGGGPTASYSVNAPTAASNPLAAHRYGGVASSMNLWGGAGPSNATRRGAAAGVGAVSGQSVCNLHSGAAGGINKLALNRTNTTAV